MIDCTHTQFAQVWIQLEAAMRDEHGYGGSIAEVYLYLVQSYSPRLNNPNIPTPKPDSIYYQDWVYYQTNAVITIYDICRMFAKTYEVNIRWEGIANKETDPHCELIELHWNWDKDSWVEELGHRLHIEVLKNTS